MHSASNKHHFYWHSCYAAALVVGRAQLHYTGVLLIQIGVVDRGRRGFATAT